MDEETKTEETTTEEEQPEVTVEEQPEAAEGQAAAAAEPEEERPHRSRFLPCPLTDEELINLGDEIDGLISKIEDLEAAKKSSASAYKAQIDEATERLQQLSKQRRKRTIDREVEIEIEQDLARGEETVRRLDTGETVARRTLSRREVEELRQVRLPGTDKAATTEEPKADPWAKLPAELAAMVEAIDGDGIDTVKTDDMRAMITYAKEAQIPPDDPRVKRITKALVERRKPEADAARAALKAGKHGKRKGKGNAAPEASE